MQVQGEGLEGARINAPDDAVKTPVPPGTDKAATAVEYGIMIAAIAGVVIAIVIAVGVQVDTALFQKVFDNMQSLPD